MTRYDDLSERALWYLQNLDELDLAESCAAGDRTLDRVRAIQPQPLDDLGDLGRAQANGWNAALDAVRRAIEAPGPDSSHRAVNNPAEQPQEQ
ncbi:hypothetical protein [Streptomyces sp. NPDC060001]|uniref:hypothetical protein n=1 Tax=Streptomyces sp. NPDC060001 TaxID=3347032 RepID=UPI0036779342